MRIIIDTIPHKDQRYDTVGDWVFSKKGDLVITVSQMKDWRHEVLVAFHELVEAFLCKYNGIDEARVSAFDRAYEELRKKYPVILGTSEPGDIVTAPYHEQHIAATALEKEFARFLEVIWSKYEKAVNDLE